MEWGSVVQRAGRHRYLVLAAVFALMAGQEIVEMAVLEQPSGADLGFPLGPLLHVTQIVAIVAGTYVLIDAFRRTSALCRCRAAAGGRAGIPARGAAREGAGRLGHDGAAHRRPGRRAAAGRVRHPRFPGPGDRQREASISTPAPTSVAVAPLAFGASSEGARPARPRNPRDPPPARVAPARPSRLAGSRPGGQALVDETARQGGWRTELIDEVGDERLPATVETGAYRIAQEALTTRPQARPDVAGRASPPARAGAPRPGDPGLGDRLRRRPRSEPVTGARPREHARARPAARGAMPRRERSGQGHRGLGRPARGRQRFPCRGSLRSGRSGPDRRRPPDGPGWPRQHARGRGGGARAGRQRRGSAQPRCGSAGRISCCSTSSCQIWMD